MFYCPLHNWSSYEKPCPACHQTLTINSSTNEYHTLASMPDLKLYNQQYVDKAIEDAFNASREYTYYDHAHYPQGTNPIAVPSPHRLYPTLESYLNSLKNKK